MPFKQLDGAFEDKYSILIVYACDNNYINYTLVSINSVIKNLKSNVFINFVIIYNDLSLEVINKIISIFQYNNASICFVNMQEIISSYEEDLFKLSYHFNLNTYLRFFIPRIFQNFEKVIYLDPDTLVLDDIKKLYDINTQSKVLTAAIITLIVNSFQLEYNIKVLKLKDSKRYLQAGVLLIDIKQAIKDNFEYKCISMLKKIKKPRYSDQDILNAIYGESFNIIDSSWNVLWHIKVKNESMEAQARVLYEQDFNNPKIIHYSSDIKPWNSPQLEYSEKWWHYARQTPFYEEILFENIQHKNNKKIDLIKHNFQEQLNSINIFEFLKTIKKKKKKYLKYKILSKILFGAIKQKYKNKRKLLKEEIKNIRITG